MSKITGGIPLALVGAGELIIIATAILLLALSAWRRRQVVKGSEQVVPMRKTLPAVPNQQALAASFNMAQEISASNGLLGRFRAEHLARLHDHNDMKGQSTQLRWSAPSVQEFSALETKPQSPLTGGQFMTQPQQTERLPGPPSTVSTEPAQSEPTPHFSVPEGLHVPSTPVPEQLVIPSTPRRLGEEHSQEEMTDPLLEALMRQAKAGLYLVPRRVDEIH